jgi:retron-type reverse transcriptase
VVCGKTTRPPHQSRAGCGQVPGTAEFGYTTPFFDTRPHTKILAVLAQQIADTKFLRMIARMRKVGVQTPGGVVQDELGSPQGSIVSPVIANVFLDTVLDQWFTNQWC